MLQQIILIHNVKSFCLYGFDMDNIFVTVFYALVFFVQIFGTLIFDIEIATFKFIL